MTPTPHSRLPRHCHNCGEDWPAKATGLCPRCHQGLACRADTTDPVAPDPPCPGSRLRFKKERLLARPSVAPGVTADQDVWGPNGSEEP